MHNTFCDPVFLSHHIIVQSNIKEKMHCSACRELEDHCSVQEGKGKVQKKKREKVWSFAKPGRGGVSEGGKKPNCFFETSIFQRVSRIILGPSKHVLHQELLHKNCALHIKAIKFG